MSHHVIVHLPDGRTAAADYRQPIVGVMRRINAAIGEARLISAADYELVAGWLDRHPEQACTAEQVRLGTCTHPPASAEPYRLPKYQEHARSGDG